MMGWIKQNAAMLAIAATVGLAAVAGATAAIALSGSSQAEPTKTVTINVENGATGPAGPKGDPGPQGPPGPQGEPGTGGGASDCPATSTFGKLVINAPGGQTSIFTCIVD